MAVTTYTSSQIAKGIVKDLKVGPTVASVSITPSVATYTTGDTVLLLNIPAGATITSIVFGGSNSGTAVVDLGWDSTFSAIASAVTLADAHAYTSFGVPIQITVSEDAAVQYRTLKAQFKTGTLSAVTPTIKLSVTYVTDQADR